MIITDADERKKIIEMYQQGMPIAKIARAMHRANENVRAVIVEAGVFEENRQAMNRRNAQTVNVRRPEKWNDDLRFKTAINRCDILKVRTQTKIGDQLLIRTEKADKESGDDVLVPGKTKSGAVRKAVVVNTNNPRFCVVQLRCGAKESILWVDIVRHQRNTKGCVGN